MRLSLLTGVVIAGLIASRSGFSFAQNASPKPTEAEESAAIKPSGGAKEPRTEKGFNIAEDAEPEIEGTNGVCGVERWAVKTLSDGEAQDVNTSPKSTTIAHLRSFISPIPPPDPNTRRPVEPTHRAPEEKKVWTISGVVTHMRAERDHDYHVVLANPNDLQETMIVEVVDPQCPGASESSFAQQLANARASFERQFPAPPAAPAPFLPLAVPIPVTVTGVGFFDFLHGQMGVAPNGIELHPVLSIERTDGKTAP